MTLPELDPVAVASVAAITTLIVQVILTATALPAPASSRWGPLIALVVGVVVVIAGAAASGPPLSSALLGAAVLTGLAGGLSAMGIHNIATKSAAGSAVTTLLGIPTTAAPADPTPAASSPAP